MNSSTLAIRAAPWVATIALFLVWEFAVTALKVPEFFLPPPSTVFKAFVDYWPAIYRNSLFTLSTTLVGFGLAVVFGLLLGLAVGASRAL